MNQGISVKYLNKSFGGPGIKNICAEMPRGYITAIIGNNGAGKTTLLKCITGSYIPDSGVVEFGIPKRYGRIGVVFDECPYPPAMRIDALSKTLSKIFDDWDASRFDSLCAEYRIPKSSKVGALSRGARMKLQFAVMLSHATDYLILDEPTSGLDPDARDGFLDVLRDYVSDEEHTVVISSHMTSDLEKIADQIILMIDGRIVFCKDRISLMEEYGLVRNADPNDLPEEHVVGIVENDFGSTALVKDRAKLSDERPDLLIDDASLEDIVIYHMRGNGR